MYFAAALAAAAATSTSGCVASAYYAWPRSTLTDEVELTESVEIRTVPDGATVRTEEGEEVGVGPLHHEVTYTVERSWRRRSAVPIIVAAAIGATVMSVVTGVATHRATKPEGKFGRRNVALIVLAGWDVLTAPVLLNARSQANRWDRAHPERVVVPATERLELRWDGWEPVSAELTVPRKTALTVRRPRSYSFDEAVIYWARTSGRAPGDAAGLFNLAEAYRRLTERTGDPADAREAARHYEAYLATGEVPDERREEVTRHLEALGAAGGADDR